MSEKGSAVVHVACTRSLYVNALKTSRLFVLGEVRIIKLNSDVTFINLAFLLSYLVIKKPAVIQQLKALVPLKA